MPVNPDSFAQSVVILQGADKPVGELLNLYKSAYASAVNDNKKNLPKDSEPASHDQQMQALKDLGLI